MRTLVLLTTIMSSVLFGQEPNRIEVMTQKYLDHTLKYLSENPDYRGMDYLYERIDYDLKKWMERKEFETRENYDKRMSSEVITRAVNEYVAMNHLMRTISSKDFKVMEYSSRHRSLDHLGVGKDFECLRPYFEEIAYYVMDSYYDIDSKTFAVFLKIDRSHLDDIVIPYYATNVSDVMAKQLREVFLKKGHISLGLYDISYKLSDMKSVKGRRLFFPSKLGYKGITFQSGLVFREGRLEPSDYLEEINLEPVKEIIPQYQVQDLQQVFEQIRKTPIPYTCPKISSKTTIQRRR